MPRRRAFRKVNKVVLPSDWSKEKKKRYRGTTRDRTIAYRRKSGYFDKIKVVNKLIEELDTAIYKMEDEPEESQDWECDHHTHLLSHSCSTSTEIMDDDRYGPDPKDMRALKALMFMQQKQKEDIGLVEISHTPAGNVVIKTEKKLDLKCYEPMIAPVMCKMDKPSDYDLNEKIN